MIVVTHYQRLLNYIVPDFVHVLVDGGSCARAGRRWPSSSRRRATPGSRRSRPWPPPPAASAMTAVAEERDAYRAGFERFAAAHAGSDPAWLRERRTAAIARFVEKGLPTARDEAWRHTPTAPLVRARFEPADPKAQAPADALAAVPARLPGARLVYVNGRLAATSHRSTPGGRRRGGEPARDAADRAGKARAVARPHDLRRDRRLRRPERGLRRGRGGGDRGPGKGPARARRRRPRRGGERARPRSRTCARSSWPGGGASAGSWRPTRPPTPAARS